MASIRSLARFPKINTDLNTSTRIQEEIQRQYEYADGSSNSSDSRSSSFLATPFSAGPLQSTSSPYSCDDSDYISNNAATHNREGSTMTLRPTVLACTQVGAPDRGVSSHTPRSVPFSKRVQTNSGRGRSTPQTRNDRPYALSSSTESDGKDYICPHSPQQQDDSPHQLLHSAGPSSPVRNTKRVRLSFPRFARRAVGDSNDTDSSTSHATSQSGSSAGGLSRSNSQRKFKLGPHRFLVSRKVGEGGFGRVYKGIEIHSGQTVAIKTVSKKGLSRSRVDATLKEQKVAQRIAKSQRDGRNIGGNFVVRMLASFLTPNHFVFVLDYHGAGDLRDVDFPLKPEHARFYIGEMALGLRFIHSLGIVMRDLKPANVLLGYDGHVRLADFGLAAMSEQNPGVEEDVRPSTPFLRTRTISLGSSSLSIPTLGLVERLRSRSNSNAPKSLSKRNTKARGDRRCPIVFCGTPGYISPEGYIGRYGPENDVWALGISLYEFITGQNPFDMWGVATTEIQKKVVDTEIFYPDGMPSVTQDIISKLLRKKWQRRITIDEMMEHPFFQAREFSWSRLEKHQITPPPLPDIAQRRLDQSVENMLNSQLPLVLHLEADTMHVEGFVEELGAQEICDFEMDGLDVLATLVEERREGSKDSVWW